MVRNRHSARSKLLLVALTALLGGIVIFPALAEPDAVEVAIGKHTFRTYCASCHGQQATGDGPTAEYLLVPPSDLTRITARNEGEFPAERIAKIIDGREKVRGHGNSEMPVWGDSFRRADPEASEEEVAKKIAALVQFLESIQQP